MLAGRLPSALPLSFQVLEPATVTVSGVYLLVMVKPVSASPVIVTVYLLAASPSSTSLTVYLIGLPPESLLSSPKVAVQLLLSLRVTFLSVSAPLASSCTVTDAGRKPAALPLSSQTLVTLTWVLPGA